jgi:hypothetical protein
MGPRQNPLMAVMSAVIITNVVIFIIAITVVVAEWVEYVHPFQPRKTTSIFVIATCNKNGRNICILEENTVKRTDPILVVTTFLMHWPVSANALCWT